MTDVSNSEPADESMEDWVVDRIVQILPAEPGTRAVFTVGDHWHYRPIVVWALTESDFGDGASRSVVGMVVDPVGELILLPDLAHFLAHHGCEFQAFGPAVLLPGEPDRQDDASVEFKERQLSWITRSDGTKVSTKVEKAVWAAWNALPDEGCKSPVKTVARQLGMSNEDVAFIVFPAERFGSWADDQEPDLP